MKIEIAPKEYERKQNWDDAMLYCSILTIDNKNDWRLPIIDELDYIYKLKYNPYKAKFNNKTIFQFKFIRDIKQGISKEIQKGNIDAILKYK